MDLNGKWNGFYEYGVGYELPFFGNRVEIEVNFNLDSEGNVRGSFTEPTSDFSVALDGELRGFINNELISFIKSYKSLPQINEDFSGIEITEGKLEIPYTGFIDHKNDAMYGDWVIEQEFVNNEGHNDIEYFTGIWILKRN
ncbi:MAG: hypothetical protein JXQ93_05855 [Flavobacteriaceae bacterium]